MVPHMFRAFVGAGFPNKLIQALARKDEKPSTAISNNCGTGGVRGTGSLMFKNNQIKHSSSPSRPALQSLSGSTTQRK